MVLIDMKSVSQRRWQEELSKPDPVKLRPLQWLEVKAQWLMQTLHKGQHLRDHLVPLTAS